ncbi:MAG: alpha/beta hydrolase-fold protein, partial [Bacteroidetes bacterium]|nr:alpha/beta hydrolase-fold protein [Bacteroidota bacterium]
MSKKIFVLLLCIALSAHAQEKVNITFRVEAPTLNDSDKVFIVGSVPELGSWNPGRVELEKISKGNYQKSIFLNKGVRIEYKFAKGTWLTEALNNDATVPQNSVLTTKHDTTITAVINNWRDKSNFKIAGQVTGKVEYHKHFVLDGLKPRDIIVWLPPDYDKNKNERYPVFYMHDGQNLFDPRTSSMFVDWQMDETADSLIRKKEIKPLIIVGIYNTEDRGIEYADTPLGHLYMKLIVEKIKPFIDSLYRTLPDRENTAVGGSSMGGLISMMCAWEYPNVFSKAACFSPAFKIADIDYVKNVLEYSGKKKKITLYIDNGGVDLDARLLPGVNEMVKALEEKGFIE